MPTSGYAINEEKTYCKTSSGETVTRNIYTNSSGEHVFKNLNKGSKCYLYFDKTIAVDNIIANLSAKTSTPTFSNAATTDEGVYATGDGMYGGTTYYWRGAVTNNYVKFADKCWRIIRINGDKTIRLIYDGSTCHANGTSTSESIAVTSQVYHVGSGLANCVGWTYTGTRQRTNSITETASNAKTQTETWYINNLASYTSKIADGKFCNDRDVQSGSTWAISPSSQINTVAYERIYIDYNPTFSCSSGDVYTLKVGAISADEVMFAGGKNGRK